MAGTYVCSSAYTLWHLKSIPNMSSKIPAWRWQRSKCPCLSSQIWSQSSSCWVFWIQTLLPDTLSMSLAPLPCSHSDLVTIKFYSNRRAVHMRAGRGHSHHPLCTFLSKFCWFLLFTFHISFALKLPATSLSLFWFWFICLFVFFIFLNPSSHSWNYNQGLWGDYGFVFVWPCSSFLLHWRSDHRPWMLEHIEHAVYHWAIAKPSVQTFKKQAHTFDM